MGTMASSFGCPYYTEAIKEVVKEVNAIHERLEPAENVDKTSQLETLYEQSPALLPNLDSNQDERIQSPLSYH